MVMVNTNIKWVNNMNKIDDVDIKSWVEYNKKHKRYRVCYRSIDDVVCVYQRIPPQCNGFGYTPNIKRDVLYRWKWMAKMKSIELMIQLMDDVTSKHLDNWYIVPD